MEPVTLSGSAGDPRSPRDRHGDPRAVYAGRLAERQSAVDRLSAIEGWIANLRLAVFAGAAVMAWLLFVSHRMAPAWLGLPVAVFIALMIVHARVIESRIRAERARSFYESGLLRLDDAWMGRGSVGHRLAPRDHPYAGDLDLFGSGSLFELLCTTRTAAGEAALARALCAAAPPGEIRERQDAAAEIGPRVDLREDLAALGEDVRTGLEPDRLVAWGAAPRGAPPAWVRVAALLPSVGFPVAFVAWAALHASLIPAAVALILVLIVSGATRGRVSRVIAEADGPGSELQLLAGVVRRLRRESFRAPLLARLHGELGGGSGPVAAIDRLTHLLEIADSTHNLIFAPIAYVTLLPLQLACAIDAWRRRHGAEIARWLHVVGDLEMLAALGTYAYEHPADPFPEIIEEGPLFQAKGLGHPLIPDSRCVRNDLALGAPVSGPEHNAGDRSARWSRLLVVSGSNMSGKSTLLRSVGINAVLALAGAPVRARQLRISPLAVGASIRIVDSLLEGTSRFYAEIVHLRRLMELASGPRPALLLIDEILQGTNSHDRRIGAQALLKSFLARGAIGLATTHDLALTEIATELAPDAGNVHFEDRIVGGEMVFDYILREDVVQKSNALELMRWVGLDV